MTSDPSMSRRVTRLENDTESLYELITDVRATQDEHTSRFDRIESTLTEVRSTQHEDAGRFDRIESTLTEVRSTQHQDAGRFDRIETTLTEVVRRLPEPS